MCHSERPTGAKNPAASRRRPFASPFTSFRASAQGDTFLEDNLLIPNSGCFSLRDKLNEEEQLHTVLLCYGSLLINLYDITTNCFGSAGLYLILVVSPMRGIIIFCSYDHNLAEVS